ncbi:MAG: ATP-binding protein [Chitinophagales bacterium]
MNQFIIGRTAQKQELTEALASTKPEMLALVGRRRVGKTYLVSQVYAEHIDFEITGLQYGNKRDQIENFMLKMSKHFPNYKLEKMPKSWLKAFDHLTLALEGLEKQAKMVVFLDELPWLATPKSGFLTGLSYFWNSWGVKQNIVVVICGSAASWMIKKVINNRGGLHNRVTRLLFLYPFTLAETAAYCLASNIKLNQYQILQLYMVMGGIPMYLDQIKPGLSVIQNIQKICFAPSGYLRHEFERLFASLFKDYQKHVAIVRALASKRKGLTRQEIIQTTKLTNSGKLTDILYELESSGFLTIYGGYGKKVKESLYRLTDAYSLFYLTFLEPLGKSNQLDFNKLSDLPLWKTWSGYTFENICLTHIDQIRKALSIAGMTSSIASFVTRPKDGLPGAQIDLLIDRSDQSINICEIKFSIEDYVVTKKDVDNIQTKKKVFRYHSKTKKHLFTTLITTMGVVENSHKVNFIDQVVTLKDLFLE